MESSLDVREQTFSTVDAAELSGASFRQIDYWVRRGVIRGIVSTGTGSGFARRYMAEQVQAITLTARLRQLGVALERRP